VKTHDRKVYYANRIVGSSENTNSVFQLQNKSFTVRMTSY